ncbi:MAG: hypothetical protein WAL91_07255, partial [Propionicimonas sp.]
RIDPNWVCTGAVDALSWSAAAAIGQMDERFPLYLGYLALAPLVMLPLAGTTLVRKHGLMVVTIVACLAPLFVMAIDYGRWFHILFTVLSICALTHAEPAEPPGRWNSLGATLFIWLWGAPLFLDPATTSQWPWVGFASSVIEIITGLDG